MNYIFIVQGEGRGHLTQAISLYNLLVRNGHQVICILVGHAIGNSVAPLLHQSVSCSVIGFDSPHLVYSKKTKTLSISKTAWNTLCHLKTFIKSVFKIKQIIENSPPASIINFYDGVAGVYNLLYGDSTRKMVAIAHQYYLLHPQFPHPKKYFIDRLVVNFNSKITALRAEKKLALSFSYFEEDKTQKIKAMPPLLREEIIQNKTLTPNQNFILCYITQPIFAEQLIEWHKKNSETVINCFWANIQFEKTYKAHENLTFYQIDSVLFLSMMKNCKAFVSTAGFESICEAFYLGKPSCIIPLPNHYEQTCNAIDAQLAGAGITQTNFDLTTFLSYLSTYPTAQTSDFRNWVMESEQRFLKELVKKEEKVVEEPMV